MKAAALAMAKPFVFVYNKTHWFTDKEAWVVFRFFAILETVGWSLLIGAIIYRRLGLPEAASVVSFAGHLHGIGFALYFLFVFLTARSMGWGVRMMATAIVAGMPPYGSLIFEQCMGRYYKKHPMRVSPPANTED